MENIFNRIGGEVSLTMLSQNIVKDYNIGNYISYQVIDNVGIDDISYILSTDTHKYIVKIFNHNKTLKDINHFIKKYQVVTLNHIKAPKVLLWNQKKIYTTEINGLYINCCVMEYINGNDLYTIGTPITKEEIDKLVNIITKMHSIQKGTTITYDEYCFMSITDAYHKAKEMISNDLKEEIEQFLWEYNKIEFSKLPICFVHGDLIASNIMKDMNKDLWLIDFYDSGIGVRILDIIKIVSSVISLYNEDRKELSYYFLEKYQEIIKLTDYELEILPMLIKADAYVGVMLGIYDSITDEKEETKFWLENYKKFI